MEIDRLLVNLGKSLSLGILASSLLSPALAQPTAAIELVLLDRVTNQPIANRPIGIHSDNGIRCIKAPCPNHSKNWQSKSNRRGIIFIPKQIIQTSTTLTVKGYTAIDLGQKLQKPSDKFSIFLTPVLP
jgi:hypothetical protein